MKIKYDLLLCAKKLHYLFLGLLLATATSNSFGMRNVEQFTVGDFRVNVVRRLMRSSNVEIFSVSSGEKINEETIHIQNKGIQRVAFLENDTIFFVKYENNQIELFEVNTGRKINQRPMRVQRKQIESARIINGTIFCVRYSDNHINLFDLQTGKKRGATRVRDHAITKVTTVVDKIFVTYQDGHICLFDLQTGRKLEPPNVKYSNKTFMVQRANKDIDLFNETTGNKVTIVTNKRRNYNWWSAVLHIFFIRYYKKRYEERIYSYHYFDLFDKNTGRKIYTAQAVRNKRSQSAYISNQGKIFCIKYKADHSIDFFNIDARRRINGNPIMAQDKWVVDVKIVNNILLVKYEDNEFDLFDKSTGIKINRNAMQSQNKAVELCSILDDTFFYVEYVDKTIDLFGTEQKINQEVIQARNKSIVNKGFIGNALIFIEYKNKKFDLFDANTGLKINQNIIETNRNKTYEQVGYEVRDNVFYIQHVNNKFDLFNAETGEKINEDRIRGDRNKRLQMVYFLGNVFCVQYKNEKFDFFNKNTGQKINENIIRANRDKRWVRLCIIDGTIFYIQYADYQIDLFDINTGDKINDNAIQAQNKNVRRKGILSGSVFCILHVDHQIDLFDVNTGDKINQEPVQAQRDKGVIGINILSNTFFYVRYADRKRDFFDMQTGNKITMQFAPDRDIEEVDVCAHDRRFIYVRYTDGEVEYFDSESASSGEKVEIDNELDSRLRLLSCGQDEHWREVPGTRLRTEIDVGMGNRIRVPKCFLGLLAN